MLVTVASYKGGVAKSTTAVHLAAFLQQHAPTLLVDEEGGGSSDWAEAGLLPFRTVVEAEAGPLYAQYQHHVVDTDARPDREVLQALAGSDLLVIPTTPDALSLNALLKTVNVLREVGAVNYRILFTICPPRPSRDTDEARAVLEELDLPLFEAEVPRAVAFQKAALSGITVDEVRDPRAGECWAAYEAVGQEVLEYGKRA